MTINQEKLSEEDHVAYADMVFEAINKRNLNATFYEIISMMAFLQFAQEKVDYAVIECGMGGRLDPTNILERPEVTAITSIAFDHVEYLGSTLEAIASEKAGIIKYGVPCVIGPSVTQDSVYAKARQMNGRLIQVKKKNFIKANHEIAEKIIESLGIHVPHQVMQQGLLEDQPCRLEKVPTQQIQQIIRSHAPPLVYLDVCSNPQAVEAVIKELINRHPTQKISVVAGFCKQKDMTSILHFLGTHHHVSQIHPVTSNHNHLTSIDEIENRIRGVIKLINSFDGPTAFREPIAGGDINQTLDFALK